MEIEIVLFTGESRHKYIEDTLLVLGAPEGYIIHFEYKKKYVSNESWDNIKSLIGKKALLVSYIGDISEKKWIPIRCAKLIEVIIEEDQVDCLLCLEKHTYFEPFKINDLSQFISLECNDHLITKSLNNCLFKEYDLVDGFKKGKEILLKHSNKFYDQNVVFSYFEFRDEKNEIILLKKSEDAHSKNIDLLFLPGIKFEPLPKNIFLHIYFFAPNINSQNHNFKITESISSPTNQYDFPLGASQIHYKYKIKVGRFWRSRKGRFSMIPTTSITKCQRIYFQTNLPSNEAVQYLIFLSLIFYAFLYSFDTSDNGIVFKTLAQCVCCLIGKNNLLTIITFIKYVLIGSLTLIGIRYFTKETE